MLGLFAKKKKEVVLYAPVDGRMIPLVNVPDKVFASKMMGEGMAFCFEGDTVCAPCDGKLTMIANTLHAFGMTLSNGAEVLVHIGLDTVNLDGEGFRRLAAQGTTIKKGTPVIQIDRDVMKRHHIDLTMPVVIVNANGHSFHLCHGEGDVTMGEDAVLAFASSSDNA